MHTGRNVLHVLATLSILCGAVRPAPAQPAPPESPLIGGDTVQYVVLNHGREVGAMTVATYGDSAVVRYQYNDRGRGPRQHVVYVLAANGALRKLELRGLSDDALAEIEERFEISAGTARWQSAIDSGAVTVDGPHFYQLRDDNPYGFGLLARYLLAQPNQTATVLPAGTARALIACDTVLEIDCATQRVRLVQIHNVHYADGPVAVWLNDNDELVATDAAWISTVLRGAEDILPALRRIEYAYYDHVARQLAARLAPPAAPAVVIRNGDVFDSERAEILPTTSVVIEGDRITAVGPAASIAIPEGARVIDATGKTVLPGMWDMHTHAIIPVPEAAALHLAAGVTTIRDLVADIDVAVPLRDRANEGTILSPRMLLAGFIEGPGDVVGPSEAIVTTAAEARRWIARYDSLGYRQIKLYNLVHPLLISPIVAEAKRRGMRVSGHVPIGVSVQTAVRLGFDEIQHAPSLITTMFQDSTLLPRPRPPHLIVEAVAQNFDLDTPEFDALLELLRERNTVIDGTFNLFQHIPYRSEPLPDGTDPVFGPTFDWLPPLVRRKELLEPPPNEARAARTEAARALYRRLIKRLYDAGITLVPGTDNVPGLSYHGELEIYERSGIPPARVLQIATIVPARVMGEDADYGSISVGKVADLVIVDGRPAERIRDLRRAELVVRAGRVYRTRDLYALAGITPHW